MKIIFLILLFNLNLYAEDAFKDYLFQSPKISKPERGSLKGDFAELGVNALNEKSGSFSFSLPIHFPAERGSMQIPFKVNYSLGFGFSEYGIGFDNSLKITRFREFGKINFKNDDLMTPWGHFVYGADGFWYPKDLSVKIRAVLNEKVFKAYLPDGTVAIFGDSSSDHYNEFFENKIYSWCLAKTFDHIGHVTTYSYGKFQDDGKNYLDKILYGGIGNRFQYQVEFLYQKIKNDFTDYSLPFKSVKNRKVSQIKVNILNSEAFSNVYTYNLSYVESKNSPGFYLKSMQKTYTSGESEPKIEFFYDLPFEKLAHVQWLREPALDSLAREFKGKITNLKESTFFDFNNDGLVDLEIGKGYQRILNNNGKFEKIDSPLTPRTTSPWCLFPIYNDRYPRQFIELNQDNTEPYIFNFHDSANSSKMVVCSLAGEKLTTIDFPKYWMPGTKTSFADMNGDGLNDFIMLNNGFYQIIYNTSETKDHGKISFAKPTEPLWLKLPYDYSAFWIKDINGDGFLDLVLKGGTSIYVHYGHADGTFERNYICLNLYYFNGNLNANSLPNSQMTWVDLNKDSLPDILIEDNGIILVYINTGTRFVDATPPGLFVNPALYLNMTVANLTGKGQTQIISTIINRQDSYIVKIDLDWPSLGLMTSLKDGKGNELKFEYQKALPQAGVGHRKTVLSKVTKIITGKSPTNIRSNFLKVSKNMITNQFLGFSKVDLILDDIGKTVSTYLYDSKNIGRKVSVVRFDLSRPSMVEFEEIEYINKTFGNLTFSLPLKNKKGIRNSENNEESVLTTEYEYDDHFCISNETKKSSTLILDKKISFVELPSFENHFSCLENEIEMSGSGIGNDPSLNYTQKLKLNRDRAGRITSVQKGTKELSNLQTISYGDNGLASSIDKNGSGTSYFEYDSYFRLSKIINSDLTENIISELSTLTDRPLAIIVKRGESSFVNKFRYDLLDRLVKSWDNLGDFSENNPQTTYQYVYANDYSPAKIFENRNVETRVGMFDKSQMIFLKTADDQDLASLLEVDNSFIVQGLTEFKAQQGNYSKMIDYPISIDHDFANLKMSELDFSKEKKEESSNDFINSQKKLSQLLEKNVIKTVSNQSDLANDMIIKNEMINGNPALQTKKSIDAFGHLVQFQNEEDHRYQYIHDSLGRIVTIIFPDNTKEIVSYDQNLGFISKVERDHFGSFEYSYNYKTTLLSEKRQYDRLRVLKLRENYTYDLIGRVLTKKLTQVNQNGSDGSTTIYSYFYDGLNLNPAFRKGQEGFLTGVSSKAFSKSFIYRTDGKLIKSTVTIPEFKEFTTQYTYLSQSSIDTKKQMVKDLNSNAIETSYLLSSEYDRFGNISVINHNHNLFAEFSYDQFGKIHIVALNGKKKIQNFYDMLTHLPNGYEESYSGNTILNQSWGFNNRGLISNDTIETAGRKLESDYQYSSVGFLNQMKRSDSTDSSFGIIYSYDSMGLMVKENKNESSKIHSIGLNKWNIDKSAYEVDNLGRVTKKDNRIFAYDESGRISHVSGTGVNQADYYYDEENNPILKIYETGMTEVYVDDNAYIGDTFYEPLKIGHRVVGYFKNGIFVSTSQDLLNTNVVDENGAINIATPYGERTVARSEVNNVLDFTLKGYDREIDAVRMGHRYYDPHAKRFLSPDPFFFENPEKCIDSAVECNLYSYAGNNPITNYDPNGLFVFGTRPLRGLDNEYSIGKNNIQLLHEHGFYEDGTKDNIGFGDKGFMKNETIVKYTLENIHYNDSLMKTSEENVTKTYNQNYKVLANNCQDFADALRSEYSRLDSWIKSKDFIDLFLKNVSKENFSPLINSSDVKNTKNDPFGISI